MLNFPHCADAVVKFIQNFKKTFTKKNYKKFREIKPALTVSKPHPSPRAHPQHYSDFSEPIWYES